MIITEHEYIQVLKQISAYCPAAATYFNDLPEHDQVFQYAQNREKVATHGHKTSNAVGTTNAIWVKARKNAPYSLNAVLLKWTDEKFTERVLRITKFMNDGHQFIPYSSHRTKLVRLIFLIPLICKSTVPWFVLTIQSIPNQRYEIIINQLY